MAIEVGGYFRRVLVVSPMNWEKTALECHVEYRQGGRKQRGMGEGNELGGSGGLDGAVALMQERRFRDGLEFRAWLD